MPRWLLAKQQGRWWSLARSLAWPGVLLGLVAAVAVSLAKVLVLLLVLLSLQLRVLQGGGNLVGWLAVDRLLVGLLVDWVLVV